MIPSSRKSLEEMAKDYATIIKHPMRADGTSVEQRYFIHRDNNAFLAGAEAGWKLAIEAAVNEAESWWQIFNFTSFSPDDTRRFANPNQIAARIRALAEEKPDES